MSKSRKNAIKNANRPECEEVGKMRKEENILSMPDEQINALLELNQTKIEQSLALLDVSHVRCLIWAMCPDANITLMKERLEDLLYITNRVHSENIKEGLANV
jgi:hypothetical protein